MNQQKKSLLSVHIAVLGFGLSGWTAGDRDRLGKSRLLFYIFIHIIKGTETVHNIKLPERLSSPCIGRDPPSDPLDNLHAVHTGCDRGGGNLDLLDLSAVCHLFGALFLS